MALSLTLMNVECAGQAAGAPSGQFIAIHGSGLDNIDDLVLTRDGVPVTFFVGYHNAYVVHVYNFPGGFQNGHWCARIRNVEFCVDLTCPKIDHSGLYFIDSSRQHFQDFYNYDIKKIPDPTIRTALFGE